MMRADIVERDAWMQQEEFHRVLAVYQALPGPEATELAVYFGMRARGRMGGIVTGLGFVLPGFLLMFALSILYVHIGFHPAANAFFLGSQAGVLALMARSLVRLSTRALTTGALCLVFLFSIAQQALGVPFIILLALCGTIAAIGKRWGTVPLVGCAIVGIAIAYAFRTGGVELLPALTDIATSSVAPADQAIPHTLLFWSGLKAGLLTFGGAYTVLPFLAADTIGQGWVTLPVFLDGVALSGIIPAPFIIFATFIGYVVGGSAGALTMTIGIFLPAFAITLLGHAVLETCISYRPLQHFFEGVTAGVMGLFAATVVSLVAERLTNGQTAALAVAAFAIMSVWKSKISIPLCILGAGGIGMLLQISI